MSTASIFYAGDVNPSNNTGSDTVRADGATGPVADLDVRASGPAFANPGAVVKIAVTVTNRGPAAVNAVTLNSVLPPLLQFDSAATDVGVCPRPGDAVVDCAIGRLAAGERADVTLFVRTGSPGAAPLVFQARDASVADPLLANNAAAVGLTIPGGGTAAGTDTDQDAMSDAFERQFGLDPALDDGALDPDGDGRTNLQPALDVERGADARH